MSDGPERRDSTLDKQNGNSPPGKVPDPTAPGPSNSGPKVGPPVGGEPGPSSKQEARSGSRSPKGATTPPKQQSSVDIVVGGGGDDVEEEANDRQALLPEGAKSASLLGVPDKPYDGSSGFASYEEGASKEQRQARRGNRCENIKLCCLCWFFGGITLAAIAFTCAFAVDPFLQHKIKQSLVIHNSTTAWSQPVERPIFSIRIFNITNVEDVLKNGRPMMLRESGPYSYRLQVEKTDITWNSNNTVSYRERITWHHDPELSQGSEDDVITTVDVPKVALAMKAGNIVSRMMNVDTKNPFVTRSVKELLWGYESSVLKKLGSLGKWDVLNLFPDAHVSPIFSYLKDQNGTSGPLLNVYTGEGDFSKLNQVFSWDYRRDLSIWSTKAANKIRGTDGSMFQPFLDEQSKLTIFYGQLFRTFDLAYQEHQGHSGVDSLRFIISDHEFSNNILPDELDDEVEIEVDTDESSILVHGRFNINRESDDSEQGMVDTQKSEAGNDTDSGAGEENSPSETGSSKNNTSTDENKNIKESLSDGEKSLQKSKGGYCSPKCLPHGVYSIQAVSQGVPMAVSLPHFLGADPYYTLNLDGLTPNESAHRPVFDVDRITGVTVYNRRRHQINIRIDDDRIAADYIPLFWTDVEVELNSQTMSDLAFATKVVGTFHSVIRQILLVIGAVLLLCIIGLLYVRFKGRICPSCRDYRVFDAEEEEEEEQEEQEEREES